MNLSTGISHDFCYANSLKDETCIEGRIGYIYLMLKEENAERCRWISLYIQDPHFDSPRFCITQFNIYAKSKNKTSGRKKLFFGQSKRKIISWYECSHLFACITLISKLFLYIKSPKKLSHSLKLRVYCVSEHPKRF